MGLKSTIGYFLAIRRARQIQKISKQAIERQQRCLFRLLKAAENTEFGKEHQFSKIRSIEDFQNRVPIRNYEAFLPYLEKVFAGQKDILWPGKPIYLAKTSGTTAGTKWIPISSHSMPFHIQGARDALALYIAETKKPQFLEGKMMFLSGSPALVPNEAGILVGRLSGIAHHYVPKYLLQNRLPTFAINCIEDWEEKISKIIEESYKVDLRLISGIPPWVQMFFEKAFEYTGKKPSELWPNLQVFFHGGVDYSPYRSIFLETLGKNVDVVEVYPASEGFIAVQDSLYAEGLLLLVEGGIFYEFVPLEEYDKPNPARLTLKDVRLGQQYAIILTTNAGLWAYEIGDTIRFTSLNPYRIKVTGRIKHFISAFGEHVIEEEVNQAIQKAASQTGAQINEFTVAPNIGKELCYHEWFIEFVISPQNLEVFTQLLDAALREQNIYYNDLRKANVLQMPRVQILQLNACRNYMKSIGKLGGQNKFPHLSNQRNIAQALLPYLSNK
ncbi:MAG: GH3 auxin-responsive promoter family protein [Bacteroidia bacterium]|nr:GH3 auxin-responsive promoter family protein [Bacteroidia bacterium]MDW8159139.1 GH3 auxin-responsive promoter family protein [Bacteroidia bacterium]